MTKTTEARIRREENLRVWDVLAKTDPKHTKPFKRAGGFSGTAIKPIWIVQRLTELFGPVGMGWGFGKPEFQVVPVGNEVMVYCSVECWHTHREHTFYGVGGDKVCAARSNGTFHDDEAFKKAFTDAINNGFKFAGVGADVHMGQFDDSKYVREVANEFAQANAGGHSQGDSQGAVNPQPRGSKHSALRTAYKQFVHELNGVGDGDELAAFLATADSVKLVAAIKDSLPHIWDGENWPEGSERPEEWEPLADLITRRQRECAEVSAQYMTA